MQSLTGESAAIRSRINNDKDNILAVIAASSPCTMNFLEEELLEQTDATSEDVSARAIIALGQLLQDGLVEEYPQYPEVKSAEGPAWEATDKFFAMTPQDLWDYIHPQQPVQEGS